MICRFFLVFVSNILDRSMEVICGCWFVGLTYWRFVVYYMYKVYIFSVYGGLAKCDGFVIVIVVVLVMWGVIDVWQHGFCKWRVVLCTQDFGIIG